MIMINLVLIKLSFMSCREKHATRRNVSSISTLKMEAVNSSEKLVRDYTVNYVWLKHSATSRKVVGWIPDAVIRFF
jgi:hypothetical protein